MYTSESSRGCNGYPDSTLDECMRKCERSEVPTGCKPPIPNPICRYAVWNKATKICHLAMICTEVNVKDGIVVALTRSKIAYDRSLKFL